MRSAARASGFVDLGAREAIFFYRANMQAFLEDAKDKGDPQTDSPQARLRLDANSAGNVTQASVSPLLVVPPAGGGTFTITAVGLNFSSITWIYKASAR